jgi:hypothetical protein
MQEASAGAQHSVRTKFAALKKLYWMGRLETITRACLSIADLSASRLDRLRSRGRGCALKEALDPSAPTMLESDVRSPAMLS